MRSISLPRPQSSMTSFLESHKGSINHTDPLKPTRGMTLIELLVVMAVMILLAAVSLPAISFAKGRKFERAVMQVTSIINLARQKARTKNTYTWVLFAVTSGTAPQQLTVLAVDSQDGTDPIGWGTYPSTEGDSSTALLEYLAPAVIIEQVSLEEAGTIGTAQIPLLPTSANNTNDLNNALSVTLNVAGKGNITFNKAIRFLPTGEAGNNDATSKFVELDLQPSQGGASHSKNGAVIRIDKASGLVQLYRP